MTIGFVIVLFTIGLFMGLVAILGSGFHVIAEERAAAARQPSVPEQTAFFADDSPTVEHAARSSREQVALEVQRLLASELRLSARLADDPERFYSEHVYH